MVYSSFLELVLFLKAKGELFFETEISNNRLTTLLSLLISIEALSPFLKGPQIISFSTVLDFALYAIVLTAGFELLVTEFRYVILKAQK